MNDSFPAIGPAAGTLGLLSLAAILCLSAQARDVAGGLDAMNGMRLASLAQTPPEPALRLTAKGSFDAAAARAGDTVRYRLRVEWRDVPAAVMLLPREALETPGFMPAGSSTVHRKSAANEGTLNVTEYTYKLVAMEAGTARVAPFALRYHNGLTGREESVNVPGALLEIAPARKPFTQRTGVRVLAFLIVLAVLLELLRRRLRERRARREKRPAPPMAPRHEAEIASLQRRCEAADSRAWLTDAERLCTEFLCRQLGASNPANVRFEAALDRYLARNPGTAPGEAAAWSKLRDLFHEARYAGGRRQPHELREACFHLNACLILHGENQP
jgi:hypothetical protein